MDYRPKQLKSYIKQLNPRKLNLKIINIISIKQLYRGGYNINYLVNIDNNKFVFRLNIDSYLNIKNQVEYEFKILQHLEPYNLSPKPYFIDTTKKHFKCDLLVEEYIESKPYRLNDNFFKELGEVIRKLHSLPLPRGNWLIKYKKPLKDHWLFIVDRLEYIDRKKYYQELLKNVKGYISKIEKYVERHSELFTFKDSCLNHKDLVAENILKIKSSLKLVDWEVAMVDDPSYDLTYLICDIVNNWVIGRPLTKKEIHTLFTSYKVDDKLLNKIHIRSPLIYFELIVWVAYRASFLKYKLANNQVDPEDKEFFRQRILRYENIFKNNIDQYLKVFN